MASDSPSADARPWAIPRPAARRGQIRQHRLRSAILGNERRVWVYTPPGYVRRGAAYALLVLLDGESYLERISAPTTLDNLLAEERIWPPVALLVDNPDEETRDRELPCYPPFAAFLADELLPWARGRYHVTAEPARTIVAGASYGGLAAAYAALSRPERFGRVLSQSGSFWWKPDDDPEHEWLARQFVAAPPAATVFYLSVGLREAKARITPHQLVVNRHMRNVLRAKGYTVHYAEVDGGHDEQSWRDTLADGLLALAGAAGGVANSGDTPVEVR